MDNIIKYTEIVYKGKSKEVATQEYIQLVAALAVKHL